MKELEIKDACPSGFIQLMEVWKNIKGEEEIIIRTPWGGMVDDLKNWCKETGNEFLGYEKNGSETLIRLKLKR
ncbi:sulfurtransferase TusA family protein [Acidianus brierleyi]|uniref:Sulfurtransferase TusA family protein n=1 Tax=Acidianus brierleyi TaxID=41673 RepID=A0A2U9IFS6_9CREN|nr:sulfurtransferase TusA family protein [Acidianus brierleyi]AWR94898.1 sulfurtransferase TusA family protein [Acidianus brierleyi]